MFRQPKRKAPVPNLIDTSNDVPIVEGEDDEQSVSNVPNGTSFSSPNARARPGTSSFNHELEPLNPNFSRSGTLGA